MSIPNYIHVGQPKAGSTSIYFSLLGHPDICLAAGKEAHYFDENPHLGLDYYNALFSHHKGEKIVGDITPNYWGESTLKEIAKQLGSDIKVTVCLRFPVARSYSHYCHQVRDLDETYPFVEAVRAGSLYRDNSYSGRIYRTLLGLFPKKNILPLIFERDMIGPQYQQTCQRVLDFLEVEPRILTTHPENVGFLPVIEVAAHSGFINSYGIQCEFRAGDIIVHTLAEAKHPTARVFADPSSDEIRKLRAVEFDTSRMVSREEVSDVYQEFFKDDVALLRDLLEDSLPEWRDQETVPLTAPPRLRALTQKTLSEGPSSGSF
jgi:hypothetical protein